MKKFKRIITYILSAIILFNLVALMSGTKVYDEKLLLAENIAHSFFLREEKLDLEKKTGKEVDEEDIFFPVYSYNLKSLDGKDDFVMVDRGELPGYAIFTKEDMQLVEYSMYCESPYSNYNKTDSYYAGPANYFVKQKDIMFNLNTNQVISEKNMDAIAQAVRADLVKEKAEVMGEVNIKQTSSNERSMDPGPTGPGYDEVDEYPVSNRRYIDGYEYFIHAPYIHYNTEDECATVAAQLLLSFFAWKKDGRAIINPNFYYNRNQFNMYKPYNKDFISTSFDFEGSLFNVLWEYIDPSHDGASITDTYLGLSQYFINQTELNISEDIFILSPAINYESFIKENVNYNRPSVVSMWHYYNKQGDIIKGGHQVVVYGYQTFRIPKQENDVTIYENVDGFIAHYGWGDDSVNVWFNADWLKDGAVTLETVHQHNFETIYTDEHILKCDCGVIQTTNNHGAVSATISNNTSKHKIICACGYKFEEFHTYLYERVHYSNDLHIKYCKYCNYNITEEHSWKNPGMCSYCDIWMSSRG